MTALFWCGLGGFIVIATVMTVIGYLIYRDITGDNK